MLQTLKQSWFHEKSVNITDSENAKAYPKLCHLRKTLSVAENDDTDVEDELQPLQNMADCEVVKVMRISEMRWAYGCGTISRRCDTPDHQKT